jgi:hypothetical protein
MVLCGPGFNSAAQKTRLVDLHRMNDLPAGDLKVLGAGLEEKSKSLLDPHDHKTSNET